MQTVNVKNDLGKSKNNAQSFAARRARSHRAVGERQARKVTIAVSHRLYTGAENQCNPPVQEYEKVEIPLVQCSCHTRAFTNHVEGIGSRAGRSPFVHFHFHKGGHNSSPKGLN